MEMIGDVHVFIVVPMRAVAGKLECFHKRRNRACRRLHASTSSPGASASESNASLGDACERACTVKRPRTDTPRALNALLTMPGSRYAIERSHHRGVQNEQRSLRVSVREGCSGLASLWFGLVPYAWDKDGYPA